MPVRVLIVDDEERYRVAARMVVEAAEGFEVVGQAETGEDAVARAREMAPDLVLVDASLPGMDGVEAARRIVSEGSAGSVVLLLSAGEEEAVGPRVGGSGAATYVLKALFGPDRLEQVWASIAPL